MTPKRAAATTLAVLAAMTAVAIVLHFAVGLPTTRDERCPMYAAISAGLALAVLEPLRRIRTLRDPIAIHSWYLCLALSFGYLFWDPASRPFDDVTVVPACFLLAGGAATVVLLRLVRFPWAAAGLLAFWSTEAWLLLANRLDDGGLRGVSVFSHGYFICRL